MTDPRYPDAVEPDAPEFENDRQRADYYEALAKSYAAKITMIKAVVAQDWRLVGEGDQFFASPVEPLRPSAALVSAKEIIDEAQKAMQDAFYFGRGVLRIKEDGSAERIDPETVATRKCAHEHSYLHPEQDKRICVECGLYVPLSFGFR